MITPLSGGVPTHQKYKVAEGDEQERETFSPVGTAWLCGSSTVNCAPGDGGRESGGKINITLSLFTMNKTSVCVCFYNLHISLVFLCEEDLRTVASCMLTLACCIADCLGEVLAGYGLAT